MQCREDNNEGDSAGIRALCLLCALLRLDCYGASGPIVKRSNAVVCLACKHRNEHERTRLRIQCARREVANDATGALIAAS